jgi:F-type H+-transporting ATPase subunit gamma
VASLRDIKRRIGSVKNTRQITKAMKLVSGAKLRRAQERAEGAKPYADSLNAVLQRVTAKAGDDANHPLLTSHETVETVLVVLVGSDRGLCGSFNGALFRKARIFIAAQEAAGRKVVVRTYGKKATQESRTRYDVIGGEIGLNKDNYVQFATELGNLLSGDFEAGSFQEAYVAYNQFKSVMTQQPTFKRVLPMSAPEAEETALIPDELKELMSSSGGSGESLGQDIEYEYEPGSAALLDTLLPLQLQTIILQSFFESEAGEHASRMKAMDAATRNASDLIDSLTLQYNRARQAAITKELIEIVSGAEAL